MGCRKASHRREKSASATFPRKSTTFRIPTQFRCFLGVSLQQLFSFLLAFWLFYRRLLFALPGLSSSAFISSHIRRKGDPGVTFPGLLGGRSKRCSLRYNEAFMALWGREARLATRKSGDVTRGVEMDLLSRGCLQPSSPPLPPTNQRRLP